MAEIFEKRLSVGNTDTYTYTVDSAWLGAETISTHNVIVDGVTVQKNSSGVTDNVIGVSLTALASGGSQIEYEWTTSGGRSDCKTVILVVVDSCF